MRVIFNPRAMVAFRSLDPAERSSIEAVERSLNAANINDWTRHARVVALQNIRNDQYYSVRAGNALRLLGKIVGDAFIVEDVFARERLEQISGVQLP